MKCQLACALAVVVTSAVFAAEQPPLPEPAQLGVSKELPDPLVCLDGTKVTTREQWEQKRKPELKRLFQHYMYGYFPAPQKITATVEREHRDYFGGKATKKEVTIHYGPEGTPPIHLLLVTPNSRK